MLSIIVPTLNEEFYLPFLFKSLEDQEGVFEVIFTDGNSSDSTVELIKTFKDGFGRPVKLLQLKRPGLAVQKNEAVKLAQYDLLLFLDADVILPENFLDQSIRLINEKKLIFAGTKIYATEQDFYYRLIFWVYSNLYLTFLRLFKPVVNGCSMFVTKKLHYQIGEFSENVTFEDFLYSTKAIPYQRPVLLKKVYVKTSARRFYKLSFGEIIELFVSGFYNVYKAEGPTNTFMKGFRDKYGKQPKPKY